MKMIKNIKDCARNTFISLVFANNSKISDEKRSQYMVKMSQMAKFQRFKSYKRNSLISLLKEKEATLTDSSAFLTKSIILKIPP